MIAFVLIAVVSFELTIGCTNLLLNLLRCFRSEVLSWV